MCVISTHIFSQECLTALSAVFDHASTSYFEVFFNVGSPSFTWIVIRRSRSVFSLHGFDYIVTLLFSGGVPHTAN
jgi:hypothetical protein